MELLDDSGQELTGFHEAHPWSQDNRYIVRGYRKNFTSYRQILKSLCIPHNEVMNIWSHLLGAVAFLFLLIYVCMNLDKSKVVFDQIQRSLDFGDPEVIQKVNFSRVMEILSDNWNEINFQGALTRHLQKVEEISSDLYSKSLEIFESILFKVLSEEPETSHFEGLPGSARWIAEEVLNALLNLSKRSKRLFSIIIALSEGESISSYIDKKRILSIVPIGVYLFCTVFCFLCSAMYHLFKDMNPRIKLKLKNLDYAGISILLSGSSFAIFSYVFACKPKTMYFYTFSILIGSIFVFIFSLGSYIHREEQSRLKMFIYGGLGLLNLIPLFHMIILSSISNDPTDMPFNIGYVYVLLAILTYLIGLWIYTHKFPEKSYPRKFDIWLNSHVLWHYFVLCGSAFIYMSVITSFRFREANACNS